MCCKLSNERKNKIRKLKRKLTPEQILKYEKVGELWHRRMAHLSASALQKLKYVASGVDEMICKQNLHTYVVCAKAKITHKSFNKQCDPLQLESHLCKGSHLLSSEIFEATACSH